MCPSSVAEKTALLQRDVYLESSNLRVSVPLFSIELLVSVIMRSEENGIKQAKKKSNAILYINDFLLLWTSPCLEGKAREHELWLLAELGGSCFLGIPWSRSMELEFKVFHQAISGYSRPRSFPGADNCRPKYAWMAEEVTSRILVSMPSWTSIIQLGRGFCLDAGYDEQL